MGILRAHVHTKCDVLFVFVVARYTFAVAILKLLLSSNVFLGHLEMRNHILYSTEVFQMER